MKLVKFFTLFVLLLLMTLFATANSHTVPVFSLLKGHSLIGSVPTSQPQIQAQAGEKPGAGGAVNEAPREIPLFLVIFLTFGIGFGVAGFMSFASVFVYKRNIRSLRKQLKEQTSELDRLRNIPLPDSSEMDPVLPIKND